MVRLSPTTSIVLMAFLCVSSPHVEAAEIAKYDEGPFAGMGYPYSESARVGDLLFLAGQVGEDADGKLVSGGIKAEAEQMMLNIKTAAVVWRCEYTLEYKLTLVLINDNLAERRGIS